MYDTFEKQGKLNKQISEVEARCRKIIEAAERGRLHLPQLLVDLERACKGPPSASVMLGTYATQDAILGALEKGGYIVDSDARSLIKRMPLIKHRTKVHVAFLSVRALGLLEGATPHMFYKRIRAMGYELCPPEVGPQLRLQYLHQPQDDWIWIAMKPVWFRNEKYGREGEGVFFVNHALGGARGICAPLRDAGPAGSAGFIGCSRKVAVMLP